MHHQMETSVSSAPVVAQQAPSIQRVVTLAATLAGQGRIDEAVGALLEAKEHVPGNSLLDIALAEAEFLRADYAKAIEYYLLALKRNLGNCHLMVNIAAALFGLGRLDDAASLLDKVLQLEPDHTEALARKSFIDMQRSDWSNFDAIQAGVTAFKSLVVTLSPGSFLGLADDPELQQKTCESYVAKTYPKPAIQRPAPRIRQAGEKIRIGYYSSDFYDHATMRLMIRMLELHDREKFEIHLFDYTNGTASKEWMPRIKATADHHHVVEKVTDGEIAALSRQLGIDIAIDLKGHTMGGRPQILVHQPAPVTVSYLGHPGTIGCKEIDYIVADKHMIPKQNRKWYSENVMYMPDCYQVTDNTRKIAEVLPSRAALGLPEDAFVFCSFNANYKVTPKEFDIWMRLLSEVDGSVLWMWCREEAAKARFEAEAEKRGIPADRLIFCDSVSQPDHLARLKQADLFLDTFNICAHTTASDSLWSGVPIVTLEGQQFAARVASSVLHAFDMPELVTHSPEEYEARILELACDPEQLQALREKIAQNRENTALFDTGGFTRNWEQMLERALLRAESGLKPEDLHI